MTARERVKRYMPQQLVRTVRRAREFPARLLQSVARLGGYSIARAGDYYSPLPSVQSLEASRSRWCRPSEMRGIEYDLDVMRSTLARLTSTYRQEFAELPTYFEIARRGFGPGYTPLDAFLLYTVIRDCHPSRYVEVGSGISTYYCYLAGCRNEAEGQPVSITCIEPNPFEALGTIPNIRRLQADVQSVELSLFANLVEGDVLFIDSSHVLKVGGDVSFLFLEVLPLLKPGVLVHIHDVPFPYNFPFPPDLWIFGHAWPMFWSEAMLVQAFLAFNSCFRIIMSLPLIRYFDEPFLKRNLPDYRTVAEEPNTFSSMWIQRV